MIENEDESGKIENSLSYKIVGASIEVHQTLGGPGLLESIYEGALCHELMLRGLMIQKQVPVQVTYKSAVIKTHPFYVDIIVEKKVIVEVKATENENPIFESQLLTYLRLTGIKLGLLINFGNKYVKDGVTRVVNNL